MITLRMRSKMEVEVEYDNAKVIWVWCLRLNQIAVVASGYKKMFLGQTITYVDAIQNSKFSNAGSMIVIVKYVFCYLCRVDCRGVWCSCRQVEGFRSC